MKIKKLLIMALCFVLGALIAVGGTLAYFTDRESKVNVFTVGNVSIELNETFEQGIELIPGVKLQKEVAVKNVGENDAWVWYTYAVPTNLINTAANASKNAIHFNIPGRYWDSYRENSQYWEEGQTEAVAFEDTWHWEKMNVDYLEMDGVKYTLVTVMYNGILVKGETTNLGLETVYLDTRVDVDPEGNWYWVEKGNVTALNWNSNTNGNPVIYVSAYAIQENGFADVQAAYAAYKEQWGNNGEEYATVEKDTEATAVTAENIDSIDFTQDNAIYKFSGTFTEDVALTMAKGLNQTLDATGAVFNGNVVVQQGVAHSASAFDAEREGSLTVTGFNAKTLNVDAINIKSVSITKNTVKALSVSGGNFELVIDSNNINGNQSKYTINSSEISTNEYGISLRITDYELSVTNNIITDTFSHSIGINGRQDEETTVGWIDRGANNKIKAFFGNNITVNSTQKSGRAALKIWNDKAYAPYATSGNEPNANAKALMDAIKADTTNIFTIGEGHTIFNIYDYKAN